MCPTSGPRCQGCCRPAGEGKAGCSSTRQVAAEREGEEAARGGRWVVAWGCACGRLPPGPGKGPVSMPGRSSALRRSVLHHPDPDQPTDGKMPLRRRADSSTTHRARRPRPQQSSPTGNPRCTRVARATLLPCKSLNRARASPHDTGRVTISSPPGPCPCRQSGALTSTAASLIGMVMHCGCCGAAGAFPWHSLLGMRGPAPAIFNSRVLGPS